MRQPGLRAGATLGRDDWLSMRTKAIFEAGKWDVQSEDRPVLADFPLLVESETADFLERTAETLAREAILAELEIVGQPKLLQRLGLPRKIQRALQKNLDSGSPGSTLRVMRFDFHFTSEGWRISEVNADVPGGFVEASGWNRIFAGIVPGAAAPPNTSEIYARAIRDEVGSGSLVALVHATAYSDDRQVMQHLARYLGETGVHSCLVSPAHIRFCDGSAMICSTFASGRPQVLVRFFPAEWLPNLPDRRCWESYFAFSKTLLSNPGSAIILQTKRFPLVWDELETELATWRRLLPRTQEPGCIKSMTDDSRILKPALGRVGEGIGMPGVTPPNQLAEIFRAATSDPSRWVSQARFAAVPIESENRALYPCLGVFTIGGKAAGFYGRVAARPLIDQSAQDIAVLIAQ